MTAHLQFLERIGIAAAVVDGEGSIVAANAPLSRILRSADLRGKSLVECVAATAAGKSACEGGLAYRIENEAGEAWYRIDDKSEGEARLALLTDVSAEIRSLESLRERYRTRDHLLQDAKIGTWRYDPDGELYFFSSELSLGHDNATAPVPVALLQLIQHPDDRERDTAIRERITREGGAAVEEMRYLEADGSWTHLNVHYRAGKPTASGRYEMFGLSQNITAVALARDHANDVSRTLNFALNAAEAGVFRYDFRDQTYWHSEELKKLVGEDALHATAKDPASLFVAEDRAVLRDFFTDMAKESQGGSIDVRILRPVGYRWVRFYFTVTKRGDDGTPLHGVGLLIDIDARKRQEFALVQARKDAEFASRTKTEFLATMSHELRTPLNAILGFSELMTTRMFGPLEERYVGYARDIHRSGRHLLELVNDVLDLAKLEAGKLELRETDIDIQELVAHCLSLVRARAEAGGVTLTSKIAPDTPTLRADKRSTTQLLLNLLSNAVKFTPEGGSVTVEARRNGDGGIDLSVSDTGIGMSESEIAVALSPFGQIDSTLARKSEGTGLGLPICRSLMELHGGELVVHSKPNAGTKLVARFPKARAQAAHDFVATA